MRALTVGGCLWLASVFVLSAWTPQLQSASADEILLRDGERLFGVVEQEDAVALVVRSAAGLRRLPRDFIAEHIVAPAPHVEWAERSTALKPDDVAARLELAQWAFVRDMKEAARTLAREALRLDPGNALARSLAGIAWQEGARVEAFDLAGVAPASPGRRYGSLRATAARSHGGASVDAAVRAGLDWLAAHQEEDGSFDADGFMRHDLPEDRCDGAGGGHHGERMPCAFDAAATAAALMAFMADGSTHYAGPYREPVARALRWCVAQLRGEPANGYALWNDGHVLQAVAEAYGLTRDPALRAPLQRAVDGILRLQRPDGGFGYIHSVGDAPTSAVAGLALAQAVRSGLPVPRQSLERLLAFLDARVDADSGRSEYHAGAEQKGYTPTRANAASGLAVRALLGRLPQAPQRAAQVRAATEPSPRWKWEEKEVKTRDGRTVKAQLGSLYPIQWQHAALAWAAGGGAGMDRYWSALKGALLQGQRDTGAARGSWDPLGPYSLSAGRVYITALCVQMLRAPLRFP